MSATAWDIPWIVKDDTYKKEVEKRKTAEKERDDAYAIVVILGSIVGVLVVGLFLKFIYSVFSFLVKRGRDKLKRK